MTTKSEPSAIAADPSVAAEPVAPVEAAPLASIIVDPQALAPSAAPEAGDETAPTPSAAPETNGTGAPDAVDAQQQAVDDVGVDQAATPPSTPDAVDASPAPAQGNGADALRLSDLDAERYATSYRASWEPGEALDAPMPVAPTPAAGPQSGSAASVTHEAAVAEPIVLPGNARARGVALAALAVLAFGALLALALSSTGRPSAPPRAAEAPPPAPEPEPAQALPTATAIVPTEAPAPAPTAAPIDPAAAGAREATAGAAAEPSVAGPSAEPTAAAAPEPIAAVEPAAAAPPRPPAPAPAPAVATVRIQIATSPADAELTIDGARVANPYDALVPRGGEKHRVTASAADHESRDQLVAFERKRDLVLRLKKLPGPRPEPASVAKPAARPARAAPAKTAKKPAAAPAPPRKGAAFVSESPY